MTARLTGRSAIVTGASRGLGRATALALAAEGAAVAVVARSEAQWDDRLPGTIGETVAAIEAAGGRAVAIRADLLERDDIPRLVEEARAALGPITVLVNNAAFTAPGRPPAPGAPAKAPTGKTGRTTVNAAWPGFVSVPLSAYRRHFEIGPFAAYELMQLVCPDMIEAGHGSIVNVTSVASRVATLPGYGGSKAALEHLAHHRKVIAGSGFRALDVEFAIGVLAEPLWPGDDHGADGVGALNMAVVVNLDPLGRAVQLEQLGQFREDFDLRGRFREMTVERVHRVATRLCDKLHLIAALGLAQRHLAPGPFRQRIRDQHGIFEPAVE